MRDVALWGEHIDEYQHMFGLDDTDFTLNLLEYGSGATAVNAQLHARHQSMVSCDPWFSMSLVDLTQQINQFCNEGIERIKAARSHFDFSAYGSMDGLIEKRLKGVSQFFADYSQGLVEKRYLPQVQDALPFEDFTFDMALSSSYLFSGDEAQDVDFHLNCIRELARVAKEVRIFPLIDRDGQPSSLLGPVLLGLQQSNYGVEIRDVDYLLQLGGHAMLRVWARECQV